MHLNPRFQIVFHYTYNEFYISECISPIEKRYTFIHKETYSVYFMSALYKDLKRPMLKMFIRQPNLNKTKGALIIDNFKYVYSNSRCKRPLPLRIIITPNALS